MKQLKLNSNLLFAITITLVVLLLTGTLTTVNGQTSKSKENILEVNKDQTSQLVLSYDAKGFKKALKVLVDKGIKSRKVSRIDISVPDGHIYFTVTPYLDGKITYALTLNGSKQIIFSSTKIADVRKHVNELLKLHFNIV